MQNSTQVHTPSGHVGRPGVFRPIGRFFHRNAVLTIALSAAAFSCFLIPPDGQYAGYLDWNTLACLFSTLAVICALKNIRFFTILARKIVACAGQTRSAILLLVYVTFLGSMLIANDMALLTFLPLGYFVLSSTGKDRYIAIVFVLQNIAANLGGMLTPFGNPQNLYLYTKFHIPAGEFFRIMWFPFAVSVVLITICCLLIPKEPLTMPEDGSGFFPKGRASFYLLLFLFTILMVFRLVPTWLGLLAVTVSLLLADRNALAKVDYPLLGTFACFFVFAGNLSRIPAVSKLFSFLLGKNALLTAVASCQVISNVPSAILLSQFTETYAPLLVGVNIGGVGTLVSSLASLITFREYTRHYPGKTMSYLAVFSAFQFGFLLVLTMLMQVWYPS